MEKSPFIIGIAGGSGSGKSWLADKIDAQFPGQVARMEIDWYYRDLSSLPASEARATNFDHPDAIEYALLLQQFEQLARGKSISAPRYRYDTHTRLPETVIVEPKPILVFEGLFALYWDAIRTRLDARVFIDVDAATRLRRRLCRDTDTRGYSDSEVRSSWKRDAEPMYQAHVAPTAAMAHTVLSPEEDTSFETPFLADLRTRLAENGIEPA